MEKILASIKIALVFFLSSLKFFLQKGINKHQERNKKKKMDSEKRCNTTTTSLIIIIQR